MASVDLRNINANAVVVGYHANGGVLNSVKLAPGQILVGSSGQPVPIGSSDGSVSISPTTGLSVARPFNWTFNSDFEIWGTGTSSPPTGWTLSGAGATVAKNTTAGQFKVGTAGAALTRVGNDCVLYQDVSTVFPPIAAWQGQTVTFGAWVRATAGTVFLFCNDGVTSRQLGALHPNDGSLRFLSGSSLLSNAATQLLVGLTVQTANATATIDGAILAIGSSISGWVPSGWRGRKAVLHFSSGGTNLSANPTYYGLGFASTTELLAGFIATPFKGVARNFWVTAMNAGGSVAPATDTLRQTNAADLALTVTLAAGGVVASDVVHEVQLVQGAGLDVKSTEAGGYKHMATCEYEEIP